MSDEAYDPKELFRIKTVRELATLIPRVLKIVWDVSAPLIIFIAACMLVAAVVPAATIYLTKVIVDAVFESQRLELQWGIVVVPLGIIFTLWLAMAVVDGIELTLSDYLYERTGSTASEKILRKTSTLDTAFFEAPRFYDQLRQAVGQQWKLQQLPIQIFGLFQTVISLSAMFGLISLLHPMAFAVLVISVIPSFFLRGHMTRQRFLLSSDLTRNRRQAGYLASVLLSREAVKEVRVFGLADLLIGRYLDHRAANVASNKMQMLRFMGYDFSLDVLSTIGIGVVSAYAVIEATSGRISLGTLTAVLGATQQIVGLVRAFVGNVNEVYGSSLEISRLFDLLDLEPESIAGSLEPPRQNPVYFEQNSFKDGIRIEGLTFRYPATDREALTDVSFSFQWDLG